MPLPPLPASEFPFPTADLLGPTRRRWVLHTVEHDLCHRIVLLLTAV